MDSNFLNKKDPNIKGKEGISSIESKTAFQFSIRFLEEHLENAKDELKYYEENLVSRRASGEWKEEELGMAKINIREHKKNIDFLESALKLIMSGDLYVQDGSGKKIFKPAMIDIVKYIKNYFRLLLDDNVLDNKSEDDKKLEEERDALGKKIEEEWDGFLPI